MTILKTERIYNLKSNIYQNKRASIFLAIFCAIAWAMAFPLIKVGLKAFGIAQGDIFSKTLFAGIRFFFAGIIVIVVGKLTGKSLEVKGTKGKFMVLIFGLVNTAFHYFFFYLGVSNLPGSRSAILDSLGTFMLIILSCIVFKDDKMTISKIVGCILGLCGVVLINLDFSNSFFNGVSLKGDGMLIISSICAAGGGILTRVSSKHTNPIAATGISLTFGGALLTLFGYAMGGRISQANITGIISLLILIFISSASFSVYNQLICYNPVSTIAIFNGLIPIFGVILSCIILGEKFSFIYILAGVVVAIGIYVINREKT